MKPQAESSAAKKLLSEELIEERREEQRRENEQDAARDRRFVRDVVRGELRKGNIRLALAILLWPPGWSDTRLEDE